MDKTLQTSCPSFLLCRVTTIPSARIEAEGIVVTLQRRNEELPIENQIARLHIGKMKIDSDERVREIHRLNTAESSSKNEVLSLEKAPSNSLKKSMP
jgi:hypothetical protein